MYKLTHPKTGETKEVYQWYTDRLNIGEYLYDAETQVLVSDTPLGFPIRIVNKEYLTDMPTHWVQEPQFWDSSLQKPSKEPPLTEKAKLNRFLAKVLIQLIMPNRDYISMLMNSARQTRDDFYSFAKLCFDKNFPWSYIKDTIEKYFDNNQYVHCITYMELMEVYPCKVNSNVEQLEVLCDSVLRDNPKSIEDYRKGKLNSINHLKGQVMKITKGTADVRLVAEILERKLKL